MNLRYAHFFVSTPTLFFPSSIHFFQSLKRSESTLSMYGNKLDKNLYLFAYCILLSTVYLAINNQAPAIELSVCVPSLQETVCPGQQSLTAHHLLPHHSPQEETFINSSYVSIDHFPIQHTFTFTNARPPSHQIQKTTRDDNIIG